MTNAYECDKCGKFFPGQPHNRYLPTFNQRWKNESKEIILELCKLCKDEFDGVMIDFHSTFTEAKRKREGHIKDDEGHEEG